MAKQSGNIYMIEMNDAQMDAYEAYLKARKTDSTELDALRQRVAELEADSQRLKNCYYHFKRALGDCAALTTEDEIGKLVYLALATEPKE